MDKLLNGFMVITKKRIHILLLVFLMVSLLTNGILVYQNLERNRVLKVIDGDSFETRDLKRVRLLGIDAPELDNCLGKEAKEKLSALILGKRVRLKNPLTDAYGRIMANVIVEDIGTWTNYIRGKLQRRKDTKTQSFKEAKTQRSKETKTQSFKEAKTQRIKETIDPLVNRAMVAEGMARYEFGKNEYSPTILEASKKAKEEKLGIYSDKCITKPTNNCMIKGNIRNGEKTYYLPSCKFYKQTEIDEAYGDKWFCNVNEAVKAGFSNNKACSNNLN